MVRDPSTHYTKSCSEKHLQQLVLLGNANPIEDSSPVKDFRTLNRITVFKEARKAQPVLVDRNLLGRINYSVMINNQQII